MLAPVTAARPGTGAKKLGKHILGMMYDLFLIITYDFFFKYHKLLLLLYYYHYYHYCYYYY